jgi:malonyl-CoA decarboxylase
LSPVPGYTKWVSEHNQVLFKRIDSAKNRAELEELKPNILESAGQYLFRSNRPDGKTNDPVARFHLGNGASLHQINFLGDLSKKGIKEGAGLMVNYRYVLKHVEQNHESYQSQNKIIASQKAKKTLMVS